MRFDRTAMRSFRTTSNRLRRSNWLACLIAALALLASEPASSSESVSFGADLAQRLCASCHGIDRAETSPMPAAPSFRRLVPRVDLNEMAERLQDGIIAGHPEMPVFVLKEHEARALVAYIRSLTAN
jgi:cytochrome c